MALLRRLPRQLLPPRYLQASCRGFAVAEQADDGNPTITVTVNPYKLHHLEEGPSQEASRTNCCAYCKSMPPGSEMHPMNMAHVHTLQAYYGAIALVPHVGLFCYPLNKR